MASELRSVSKEETPAVGKTEERGDGPEAKGATSNMNGGEQGDIRVNSMQAYQTQPIRTQGEGRSGAIQKYDAEDHWR